MKSVIVIFVIVIINMTSVFQVSDGARILAFIPTGSYSHQIAFHELWRALTLRGHEVVYVTCGDIPILEINNYTQINVQGNFPSIKDLNFVEVSFNTTFLDIYEDYLTIYGDMYVESIFKNPIIRKMSEPGSNEHFDLVMAEIFLAPALYGFAHRFNAPLIGLASMRVTTFTYYILGDAILTSHPSIWELEKAAGVDLSFWQRLRNFLREWHLIYVFYNRAFPNQEALMKNFFGNEMPSIHELHKKISAIFVNQDVALSYARPELPMFIPFNSFHISKSPEPLPTDLKDFLDNAKNGFIYFSFGSNVQTKHLPKPVQEMFLEVLSKLPYKVLWKHDEGLPRKFDNIYTAKWLSQQSVLAHPRIKLFISHTGLQGTQEAIHYTVPIVAIPVFADQFHQARKLESLGAARYLDLPTLTKEQIEDAILDVLTNTSYKENMMKVKTFLHDKPYDTLTHLIWWTEFIIRHKEAPHLQSVYMHDPWYQRQEMDVVAFLAISIFVLVSCVLAIFFYLFTYIIKHYIFTDKVKKVKTR